MTSEANLKPLSYPWLESYPEGITWDSDIPAGPVFEMLNYTVRHHGDRPAFNFLGKRYTWADIGDHVNRMARGLQIIGVKQEIKVGLFLPNSPMFLIAYYAVLKAGGTVVNYNPLYSVNELEHQIEDSETDIMVTLDIKLLCDKMDEILPQSRLRKVVIGRFADLLPFPKSFLYPVVKAKDVAHFPPSDKIIAYEDLIDNDATPSLVTINPTEDIAVLQYTGGTTGVPKGAMLTHANVTTNAEQAAMWLHDAQPGQEKMVGVLPFFHVFAMTAIMNLSVKLGLEIIALPRFDLAQTLKLIHKHKPHYFPAVPAIYNGINNYKSVGKYNLKSLRYCISGGAPLPVEVKKNFEKITACVVVEGYGLTEASPVLSINPTSGTARPGSIGLPFPATVIEIISLEDRKTRMPIGERGELCARGPQVMKGYYNKAEDSAEVLDNGLLHTGDVAIMDRDGFIYIVDRIKDMIITNGYKVYPRNVEEAIYLFPGVEECIVAGLPDAARGEIVKAWVKPREEQNIDEQALRTFLEDKVSKMEMPRSIEIRDKPLPKTMIGKLSRKDIVAEEMGKAKV